ncbi:MAG TPA: helix-turn-helix domain-containing protein [Verrucomicrobiae bacterium]|jgi:excisionase family DNA binding protein|nr:helix-turn-helix domain-containing protein [Verrucomicrobiae bacterium]
MARKPAALRTALHITPTAFVSSVLAEIPKGKHLSAKDAAKVLGVSLRTVRTLIKLRQINHFRIRGQIKFDPQHLNEYMAKRFVRAAA